MAENIGTRPVVASTCLLLRALFLLLEEFWALATLLTRMTLLRVVVRLSSSSVSLPVLVVYITELEIDQD